MNSLKSRRLTEEDNPFDLSHWKYCYECSVGCIGLLKDWLLRAVSSALDDGASRLSLDCVQDHALHVDIYRQMALDAYEGEQRLNHTEANREHVWRLLQGGELIAPVPPLPPRETPDVAEASSAVNTTQPGGRTEDVSGTPDPLDEAAPPPPIKKTRTRKRAEAAPPEAAERGSMVQAEEGVTPPAAPPKRGRKKKSADEAGATATIAVKTSPESTGPAPQASTDASAGAPPPKPKRTRRVGESKPIRLPVGEPESERGV